MLSWINLFHEHENSGEVKWAGLAARDSLRLESGFPLYGHELSSSISPLQAGLDWSVRNGIIKLLAKLKDKQTILIVTHEPELFKNLNTDNYKLHNGQLIPQ